MSKLLFEWDLNQTTWVYLSSLITISVFFKFNRVFSIRNLDLLGLIALAPGLLLTGYQGTEPLGFVWLFAVGGFFLVRLLFDPMLVRRPLLEPNLNSAGLTFMALALLAFLMTNVVTHAVDPTDLAGPRQLEQVLERQEAPEPKAALASHGPGYPLLHIIAAMPNKALIEGDADQISDDVQLMIYSATARTMAILAHLAIVSGIVLVGYWHFNHLNNGLAAASLYLLLPYTAQMVGRVEHVLPAALMVWAIVFYRRPVVAGIFLALSAGAMYYPVFLVPLWAGFYWHRGLGRFSVGFLATSLCVVASLALTSSSFEGFLEQTQQLLGWTQSSLGAPGFWTDEMSVFRIPVICAFVVLCLGLAVWPAQKHLGTLISCSAAVMLGTQFWHPGPGGLYVAWYLPLLLMTVFRPNLEDRVAVAVLGRGWFGSRRAA